MEHVGGSSPPERPGSPAVGSGRRASSGSILEHAKSKSRRNSMPATYSSRRNPIGEAPAAGGGATAAEPETTEAAAPADADAIDVDELEAETAAAALSPTADDEADDEADGSSFRGSTASRPKSPAEAYAARRERRRSSPNRTPQVLATRVTAPDARPPWRNIVGGPEPGLMLQHRMLNPFCDANLFNRPTYTGRSSVPRRLLDVKGELGNGPVQKWKQSLREASSGSALPDPYFLPAAEPWSVRGPQP